MARRVDSEQPAAAPKGAAAVKDPGAQDLAILQPDGEITIAGERITVREYRFYEGLRLQAQARPFFDALYALFGMGERPPSVDDIAVLLGEHEEATVAMLALATGKPETWIRELSESDGDALLLAWWTVNGSFFIRRVMRRAAQDRFGSRSGGLGSTTPSSRPDTSPHPETSPN